MFTTSEKCVQRIRTIVESIWTQNDFREYIVSISLGEYTASTAVDFPFPHQITQSHHRNWNNGISIGYMTRTGTSGAIVTNSEGEYAALTCAHLFKGKEAECVGLAITQPSFEDYQSLYKRSITHRKNCDQQRKLSGSQQKKNEREAIYKAANDIVRRLDEVRHDTPQNYQDDAETGKVIKSSYEIVDFDDRRCLRDYALLKLDSRFPDPDNRIADVDPTTGYLAEREWENNPSSVGPLRWDIHVKKRGRTTDVTYGFIAGVHGVLKAVGAKTVRREFWALPDALSTSLYSFSEPGDSGSLVWTDRGEAVGMVFAGWTVMFENPPVIAAVLPTGYWDMKSVPFHRHPDGSIDFTGLLTFVVRWPLSLIQSLEMILADVGEEWDLWVPT
jgi:hypothetical protein